MLKSIYIGRNKFSKNILKFIYLPPKGVIANLVVFLYVMQNYRIEGPSPNWKHIDDSDSGSKISLINSGYPEMYQN